MRHLVLVDLPREKLRALLDRALVIYKERLPEASVEGRWANDTKAVVTFKLAGVRVSVSMRIEPGQIAIDLPIPLWPIRKKVCDVIDEEARRWVSG